MSINKSIWSEGVENSRFPALQGDIKTDVLIVGGGIAGLLCAYMLKSAGVDCVLAEANEICSGITNNTTAKITIQHGLIFDKMIKKYGRDVAMMYLQAQKNALERYKSLCRSIECDYEEQTSYVYSIDDCKKILKEVEALNSIGCPATFYERSPLPFSIAGAVAIEYQAQFDPLKFLFEIAKDLTIYENTKVIELRNNKALTERGNIAFQKAIVATHFPFINKHGAYFLKLYQHRSYVLTLDGAPKFDGMYVDEDKKGLSFRHHNGLLLFGGGGHRTGKKGGGWLELENRTKLYYPRAKIITQWATQDCMTLDDIPYIGQYSSRLADIYVATGFNKWGMTSSMVGAMLLADLVQGRKNDFASIFSPQRSILHPQLAINAIESALNLITPTVPRCPHMGCALKYNEQEHTWDCPCHGSRFTEKGELIDNPATDDKKNI